MNGDLISREELKNHKFVGNKFVQIGGRTNGKTLRAINQAYQQGWNDAIDAIIDNAPTVEAFTENDKALAYCEGYVRGSHEAYVRPQGDIRWTDKVSITSSGDIIDFEGRVLGHINLEDVKGEE